MIKNYLNQIINGDCLNIIPKLPNSSIDLVITSPPYNTKCTYDIYKDDKPYKEYIKWLEKIFKTIYPKLKKGGRVCINIGDGKNGRVHTHTDIIEFMVHNLNYLQMATIIWDKENTSNRCSWGSFNSPKEPSFPCSFEYILIFAKETYSLQEKGITDLKKEEFINWSLALWKFPKVTYHRSTKLINKKIHPAPFPEELPRRLIKLLSWKGATVLDPFSGVGTVAVACKKLERNYIGIELSETYCKYAEDQLKYILIPYELEELE